MNRKCEHLNTKDRKRVLTILMKFEDMFNFTQGTWNTTPLKLELRDYVKPLFLQPYPVPRVNKVMFIKEVKRLVRLGVLEEANDSKW